VCIRVVWYLLKGAPHQHDLGPPAGDEGAGIELRGAGRGRAAHDELPAVRGPNPQGLTGGEHRDHGSIRAAHEHRPADGREDAGPQFVYSHFVMIKKLYQPFDTIYWALINRIS